jgi:mono/diheme cytochrome c family protein
VRIIFALAAFAATFSAFPVFAADAKTGEAVYTKGCKMCHGADGHGNAALAKSLNVVMPDLASASDESIKTAVVNGKGKMKPVASVAEKDIPDLIAFVRTLPKK